MLLTECDQPVRGRSVISMGVKESLIFANVSEYKWEFHVNVCRTWWKKFNDRFRITKEKLRKKFLERNLLTISVKRITRVVIFVVGFAWVKQENVDSSEAFSSSVLMPITVFTECWRDPCASHSDLSICSISLHGGQWLLHIRLWRNCPDQAGSAFALLRLFGEISDCSFRFIQRFTLDSFLDEGMSWFCWDQAGSTWTDRKSCGRA